MLYFAAVQRGKLITDIRVLNPALAGACSARPGALEQPGMKRWTR